MHHMNRDFSDCKEHFKPHPKPNPECMKIWKGCKEAWKKIEADKSLSKDQKAAKVKALKEGCMKKAKKMHCKCPHKPHPKPSQKCQDLGKKFKAAWKKLMADKT